MAGEAGAKPQSILLVGAGNMGGALLSGWLASGVPASSLTIVDPSSPEPAFSLARQAGARFLAEPPAGFRADISVIAVKPQLLDAVLPGVKPLVGGVAVSIAAGKTLAYLEDHLGEVALVRAMPNTPAMIGRGITGAFANDRVSDDERHAVEALLKVAGPVEWLREEADIDAVTAVSGSGPAYVFYLVECMAEAGRKIGLPADLAMRLARETVSGAGELLRQSPDEASLLRRNVTSPNGTTAAALAVLMAEDAMQPLFDRAIEAARDRARELGQ